MIKGILLLVVLAFVGGRIGLAAANWWIDHRMANAGLEAVYPTLFGTLGGALAGIGLGLGIAYMLGRRELR